MPKSADDLPNARVMLFGYNSTVAFEGSTSGVHNQAQDLLNRLTLRRRKIPDPDRPIIFIAHSLGGLVVKQALVRGQMGEKFNSIPRATYGIAFFATPHQSSDLGTKLGEIASNISKEVVKNPSLAFLESMKKDSLYSEQLADSFQQQLFNYAVLSFYETLPSKGTGYLIVDKKSSCLGLPDRQEDQIPMEADHTSICKFGSSDGPDYDSAVGNLVIMAEKAVNELHKRQQDDVASKAPQLVQPESFALHEACSRGDLGSVQSLVSSGADINVPNPKGLTPLIIAVSRDNFEIVDFLLGIKAKTENATSSEKSALGFAIDNGNIQIARLLLENKADPNENSTESMMLRTHPVGHVVISGNEEMVKLLLEKKADANGIPLNSRYRWTPMHLAVKRHDMQDGVIKLLLEYGATIDKTDALGHTPVDYCVKDPTLGAVLKGWLAQNRFSDVASVLGSKFDRGKSKKDPKANIMHLVLSNSKGGFYGLKIPMTLDTSFNGTNSAPLGEFEIPWHEQEQKQRQQPQRQQLQRQQPLPTSSLPMRGFTDPNTPEMPGTIPQWPANTQPGRYTHSTTANVPEGEGQAANSPQNRPQPLMNPTGANVLGPEKGKKGRLLGFIKDFL